jgi:hypothetical protein
MTETVSADADPVSADADLVSADGGTVSADGADAGSASANAGHHSGLGLGFGVSGHGADLPQCLLLTQSGHWPTSALGPRMPGHEPDTIAPGGSKGT